MVYMEGKNILTRICFMAGMAILSAVALIAAPPDAATPRVKTVVRVDPRTGKLVRVVVAQAPVDRPANSAQAGAASSSAASASASTAAASLSAVAASAPYRPIVERIAAEQSLPPELLHSVIQVESNYNPGAVSPKGAQGLMQLMPDTARRFGVPDSFDPVDNIQGGAKYLKHLLELYKGDYPRALAAYNAGEKAVAKYGGIPPYAETQNYVAQVQRRIEASKPAAKPAALVKKEEPKPIETAGNNPRHIQEIVAADGSVRYITR
jgi:soluble lytic murein transglycosylase-like protein